MTDEPSVDEPDRNPGAAHPRETPRLFGQQAAERRFLDALATGRVPHAWLITGPRGVGKATLAWRIARHMLAGAAGGDLDMDAADPVFRQVRQLASPALYLCRRPWDDKAKRLKTAITVDEVRGLKGFFQMSAADGGWRVALVDAAEELSGSAANALLKLLEEPPPRALILLVCHRPTLLLPTIRSRCRELRCAPLEAADLAAALEAAGALPGGDAVPLQALAGGSVGRALDLLAGDGPRLYAEILAMLAPAPPVDRARAVALSESCSGREGAARFDLALDLLGLALARLARAGAGGTLVPVSDAEARVAARLAATPAQARVWAALVPALLGRAAEARAVNLDPAQVILDTCLRIDAAAADALGQAA